VAEGGDIGTTRASCRAMEIAPQLMDLPLILFLFGAVALTLVLPAIRGMFR
jgi:hypothetical protein